MQHQKMVWMGGLADPPLSEYDTIWVHDIYAGQISSSPGVANNRVYIGAGWPYSRGTMYCLDATGDGIGGTTEVWVYETPNFLYSSPSVANGHVYVADTDCYIYRFGALNGTDLTVRHKDVTYSLPTPQDNTTAVNIQATITNIGSMDAFNVMVRMYDDINDNGQMDLGELIGESVISSIAAYGQESVSFGWIAAPVGYHNILIEVDPFDTIDE